ncbi:c-type cytochrome biogenesis protein CcmI [Neorhizobium galegae]|uniref:c-type cytochrome biogenesis protein CcmI n=1 Tax=Neorhizobium galegae TaxID=399 RepID=UPI0006281192|nr:c-type cytochrome biogenesis protein CcmI [Neorhizobium galegae]KAB1126526.1 c-type cytochrome biogenesis protein CcmI [Neorhizobium galegae]MCQ1808170.1 c-type cytochrome biogenesis protein CcmI [Neorhizobium galegae]
MVLWIILAALTAAVAAILILPFARAAKTASADRAGEVAVYRDQLAELDRDQAQGLIEPQEAEYARAEIGRRLLAAAAAGEGKEIAAPKARKYALATTVVTLVPPLVGLCLYLALGNPGLPDQPLEARLANPGNNVALLVAKAERHLAENPNDGAGWDLLAPIYFRSMRLGDAEMAYRNAIRILGPSPVRLAGLGETLVASNDGIVTEDARSAFEQAVKLDPDNPRSRFYVGLGFEQAGRAAEARAQFETIAKGSPADAPWMQLVNQHIVKNGGTIAAGQDTAQAPGNPSQAPGNPSQADVAAAANMSQGDRQTMIRGMVESLAERLKQDPNNLEGWVRLVRSYSVLGDKSSAEEALKSGLKQFPSSGELVALANEMGITVEGVAQ